MRKPQDIQVIVHYPTTYYGMISFIKRIVYADPDLLYERIKKSKHTKAKKAELMALAREEARTYARDDLVFYRIAAKASEDKEKIIHVP